MICVGIDVAKDKHDCFILSSEGEVLADVSVSRFTGTPSLLPSENAASIIFRISPCP